MKPECATSLLHLNKVFFHKTAKISYSRKRLVFALVVTRVGDFISSNLLKADIAVNLLRVMFGQFAVGQMVFCLPTRDSRDTPSSVQIPQKKVHYPIKRMLLHSQRTIR
ncbi:MAG: hypothetical protein COA99_17035 [Moraxellaceae bacterium]|nr:MAG: hypothetical protein COA99_17035 [Moraxellaceae bacterium]